MTRPAARPGRTGRGRRRSPRPASSRAPRRSTSCGSTATTSGGPRAVRPRAAAPSSSGGPPARSRRTSCPRGGTPAPRCTSTAAAPGPCATASLWFSAWADQRLYRLDVGAGQAVPQPVTPHPLAPRALRYADADLSPDGAWLVCVRERHDGAAPRRSTRSSCCRRRPARTWASRSSPSCSSPAPTSSSSPRISPDGIAAGVDPVGPPEHAVGRHRAALGAVRPRAAARPTAELVAGGPTESVVQPTWTDGRWPARRSDRTGWWNVYRFTGGRPRARRARGAHPDRRRDRRSALGLRPVVVRGAARRHLVVSLGADGLQAVGVVAPGTGRVERLDTAVHRGRPAPRRSAPPSSRWSRPDPPTRPPRCAAASPPRARSRPRSCGPPATSGSTRPRSRRPSRSSSRPPAAAPPTRCSTGRPTPRSSGRRASGRRCSC